MSEVGLFVVSVQNLAGLLFGLRIVAVFPFADTGILFRILVVMVEHALRRQGDGVVVIPFDLKGSLGLTGTPVGGGDHRHTPFNLEDILYAGMDGDIRLVERFHLRAIAGRAGNHGIQHARLFDINAVHGGAGGLGFGIQPFHLLADVLPLAAGLQGNLDTGNFTGCQ